MIETSRTDDDRIDDNCVFLEDEKEEYGGNFIEKCIVSETDGKIIASEDFKTSARILRSRSKV